MKTASTLRLCLDLTGHRRAKSAPGPLSRLSLTPLHFYNAVLDDVVDVLSTNGVFLAPTLIYRAVDQKKPGRDKKINPRNSVLL